MGAYVYTLETGCQTCQHFDQDARPNRFELQNFALMASASWLNEVGAFQLAETCKIRLLFFQYQRG